MGPRAGLDGIRSPDLPDRSESLYRLRYTGPRYQQIYFLTWMEGGGVGRIHVIK